MFRKKKDTTETAPTHLNTIRSIIFAVFILVLNARINDQGSHLKAPTVVDGAVVSTRLTPGTRRFFAAWGQLVWIANVAKNVQP